MTEASVEAIDTDRFVTEFLVANRPMLARGAARGWPNPPPWDLAALAERFRNHRVPLFDTLFEVNGVTTFGRYVARFTGGAHTGVPPYLRWFAQQTDDPMPWADEAFAAMADEWSMPGWLPDRDYVFPRYPGPVNAARDPFPAKGFFICGRDGRTRLHVDPWATDACLCQATGRKRFMMFRPGAAELLTAGADTVDLDHPDDERFPRWREATPDFDEVLEPGDAVFIPAGWFHTAIALDDSVSVTWNFVHRVSEDRFERHLAAGGSQDPTVRYFLGG
jgi:hypothetical protein